MTSIIDLQVTTGKCQMMHILLDDDLGRLTVRRLWPWHRLLARCLAPSLDRQLADGVRPEANAVLAARAMVLTSVRYRRGLAGSLRRLLAASVSPQTRPRLMVASRSAGTACPGHWVAPASGPRKAAPSITTISVPSMGASCWRASMPRAFPPGRKALSPPPWMPSSACTSG